MSEEVPEFGGRDVAVAILVEVPEPLDEVVGSVGVGLPRDGLQDGQEHLETDALLCTKKKLTMNFLLNKHYIRISGAYVLSGGPLIFTFSFFFLT